MLMTFEPMSPWAQTVRCLDQSPFTIQPARPRLDRTARSLNPCPSSVVVRVLERPTSTTATIEWRDSTLCCYGNQLWRASRARSVGTCAISGASIHHGDRVYRPTGRPLPRNASAMILTSEIDNISRRGGVMSDLD